MTVRTRQRQSTDLRLRRQSDAPAGNRVHPEGVVAPERDADDQPGTGQHEWRRFHAGWHGGFVGLAVLTAGFTSMMHGIGTATRIAVVGLVAVLLGWYAVAGVRGMRRRPGWFGPAYLAVAVPVTVAVFAVTPV